MEAALHVMRRNGFQGASVQDILDRAGLSTRAFYRQSAPRTTSCWPCSVRPLIPTWPRSSARWPRPRPAGSGAGLGGRDGFVGLRPASGPATGRLQHGGPAGGRLRGRGVLTAGPSDLASVGCPGRGGGRRLVPVRRPGARCRHPVRPGLECGSSAATGRSTDRTAATATVLRFCLPALGVDVTSV